MCGAWRREWSCAGGPIVALRDRAFVMPLLRWCIWSEEGMEEFASSDHSCSVGCGCALLCAVVV
jgi:hypothetical protein